jgi:hypothetical protein
MNPIHSKINGAKVIIVSLSSDLGNFTGASELSEEKHQSSMQ